MKQVKGLLLVLGLMFVLAACGSSEGEGSSNGGQGGVSDMNGGNSANAGNAADNGPDTANAAPTGETVTVKFGEPLAEDHPLTQGSYRFKELVEAKSGGEIVIEIYPNSQLGSLRELVESTQMGAIQMTRSIDSVYSGFVPELEVLQYPYVMPTSEDEIQALLGGEVGDAVLASFENYSLKALGFWPQGYKMLTSNKPLLTPEDMRGVKMRVVPSNILVKQYEAWGATPVAIDFAELYTALQQGTADAQENPVDSIYSTKMYEVQEHLSMLNHAYQLNIITVNKAWFDGLSAEHQAIIQEAHDEVTADYREQYEQQKADLLAQLEEEGMELHTLSEEQIDAFRELSLPLHDALVQSGEQQALLDLIRAQ
ncbi:TRAP transporter substrate-binding protein [Paenibacillus sp. IB182496]|uniref:TRAP transporter substrate-binding protein n=1 Tax=Paenibacillus sabuli TaxID=2772509 RepID=A0A927BNH6_9BACL|nr:TRAP transporter substrate-binding protein [Paenibacillus sabuli]MBD2843793.1 TRAP transporter substrate-binding protein [Paenibacillus sabuli]